MPAGYGCGSSTGMHRRRVTTPPGGVGRPAWHRQASGAQTPRDMPVGATGRSRPTPAASPQRHARPQRGLASSGDSQALTLKRRKEKRSRGRADPGRRRPPQGMELPSAWGRGLPSCHKTKAAFRFKRRHPQFPARSRWKLRPHARGPCSSSAPGRPAPASHSPGPRGPPRQPRRSSAAAAAEAPERRQRGRAAPAAGSRRPAAPLWTSRSRVRRRAGPAPARAPHALPARPQAQAP